MSVMSKKDSTVLFVFPLSMMVFSGYAMQSEYTRVTRSNNSFAQTLQENVEAAETAGQKNITHPQRLAARNKKSYSLYTQEDLVVVPFSLELDEVESNELSTPLLSSHPSYASKRHQFVPFSSVAERTEFSFKKITPLSVKPLQNQSQNVDIVCSAQLYKQLSDKYSQADEFEIVEENEPVQLTIRQRTKLLEKERKLQAIKLKKEQCAKRASAIPIIVQDAQVVDAPIVSMELGSIDVSGQSGIHQVALSKLTRPSYNKRSDRRFTINAHEVKQASDQVFKSHAHKDAGGIPHHHNYVLSHHASKNNETK